MSAPIGPGDWVECIDASIRFNPFANAAPNLVVGALYQVADVSVDHNDNGGLLRLAGVEAYTTSGWFAAERFRPVYRPRADLIETLMQPVDGVKPRVDA